MSSIQKRYQVFVSSTSEDLKEERMEVLHALLELDCIPCGMEYFPASSESQWQYIMQLIDNCDYYMVILGNRYGSEAEDGKSYTQKEYEYAVSKGIPVIGFFHRDPNSLPVNRSESSPEKQEKLKQFRKLIQSRLAKPWESAKDLGGVVSRSLVQEMKHNPRLGWVRASELDKLPTSEEMLKVMKENKILKDKLEKYNNVKDDNIKNISSGDDGVELKFGYMLVEKIQEKSVVSKIGHTNIVSNWNAIFKCVSNAIKKDQVRIIEGFAQAICSIAVIESFGTEISDNETAYLNITEPSTKDIMQHLQALSLVTNNNLGWALTAKGESKYLSANAMRKGQTRFPKDKSLPYNFYYKRNISSYKVGEIVDEFLIGFF
ncbi:MAG TPA: DUF4062 domain-containing protein [Chitinophagales bacterium]|nr:DUF4062 domain-containing protein [Chitinophagales bacterium]